MTNEQPTPDAAARARREARDGALLPAAATAGGACCSRPVSRWVRRPCQGAGVTRRAAAWSMAACLAAACALADDVPLPLQIRSVRSASRDFVLAGTNVVACMQLGRWADDVAARLEDLTGDSLAPAPHEIRISLFVSPEAGRVVSGGVLRWFNGAGWVRRLQLRDVADAARRDVEAALCGMIVETMADTAAPGGAAPSRAPDWLARGLAENLDPSRRARNAARLDARWRRGEFGTLSERLRELGDAEAPVDGPFSGVLVSWLLRTPDREARFRAVCRRMREDAAFDEAWFMAQADARSPAALEEAWDLWMLRQRRVVRGPAGSIRPGSRERLGAALLLYPGDCAIPLHSDIAWGASFEALIPRRESEWMGRFCRAKTLELQEMTAGQDAVFRDVVVKYTIFLERLAAGKGARDLRAALAAAEKARQGLAAPGGVGITEDEHD